MKTAISAKERCIENTVEINVEEDCIKSCKYLCKVIGEAIGDRTVSFKVDKDIVRLDYTFSSGATMSQKFQNIAELDTFLQGMWEMFLVRRWIRG